MSQDVVYHKELDTPSWVFNFEADLTTLGVTAATLHVETCDGLEYSVAGTIGAFDATLGASPVTFTFGSTDLTEGTHLCEIYLSGAPAPVGNITVPPRGKIIMIVERNNRD